MEEGVVLGASAYEYEYKDGNGIYYRKHENARLKYGSAYL